MGRCRCCSSTPTPDTWDEYFGAKVTHGTIFRRAVEDGIIDAGRSVQIGLRGSL